MSRCSGSGLPVCAEAAIARTTAAASSSTPRARACLLSKWKCSAPLLTPALLLMEVSEATAKPSRANTSAAARTKDSRVRAARSCFTIDGSP